MTAAAPSLRESKVRFPQFIAVAWLALMGAIAASHAQTPAAAALLTVAQERALMRGDSFRECENCPEMVVVPAGSFTMGSPKNEKDRLSDDEGPQHVVTISKPFAVGKFHVPAMSTRCLRRRRGMRPARRATTLPATGMARGAILDLSRRVRIPWSA
jgi:hypothetical protein